MGRHFTIAWLDFDYVGDICMPEPRCIVVSSYFYLPLDFVIILFDFLHHCYKRLGTRYYFCRGLVKGIITPNFTNQYRTGNGITVSHVF